MPKKIEEQRKPKRIQKEYPPRFRARLSETGVSEKSLAEALTVAIPNASKTQVHRWVRPHGEEVPTIEPLGVIAKELHTSVGYLVGIHDIPDLENDTDKSIMALDRLQAVCDESNIFLSKIASPMWIGDIRENKRRFHRVHTIVRLANELQVSLDYLLGLSQYKHIESAILQQGLYHQLPDKTPFVLAKKDDQIAIYSKEKKCFFLASEEDPVPFDSMKEFDPKLCRVVVIE